MHRHLTYFGNSIWDQGKRKLKTDDRPHGTPVLYPEAHPARPAFANSMM